ncbi:MAG: ABC transporter ATP-binding protein, partial [Christensenellales bacterium]|nr:ABC transporter ATP-binding protein [Christensenellales bacterium]
IIADEPTSALDVSIQAQILNLMMSLKNEMGLSYLFISHNLAAVKHISDRVAVMYLGNMMEISPRAELYSNAMHPYTQALLSIAPVADIDHKHSAIVLKGDVPSPAAPPPGCRFHTRCPKCMDKCRTQRPALVDRGGGHLVACHLYD